MAPNYAAADQPTALFGFSKNGQESEETTVPYNIRKVGGGNLGLVVGTRTDPGIKRKHKPNEDSLFAMQGARTHNSQPQQFGLFVVADGMGGHANGQDASRLAIQTMIDFMLPRVSSSEQMDDEAFLKLMTDGVQRSNQAVHSRNVEAHADMGTTMTAALVVGSVAYVANVGDSRTYLYREGQGLSKVTHDHSVVASLVEAGIIKPDDIYTHPKRNQIYRSLGEKPVVEVDTFKVNLLPGDKLMLCSDGLWDMVRDPLIQEVLSKATRDPNKTGQALIKAALEGGGEDNVSVIVVQFAEMNESASMTGVQLLAKPESVTVPNLPPL
jgi:serine/threonine protein phosphatase PrpC